MVKEALKYNYHVICDKPLSVTVEETLKMIECSKNYNKQLVLVDHELRYLDLFIKMKNVILNS